MIKNSLPLTKSTNSSELDLYFLDLALALAAKGEGQVKPNPLVGAVIARDGIMVGRGFHRYEGVKQRRGIGSRTSWESRAGRNSLR